MSDNKVDMNTNTNLKTTIRFGRAFGLRVLCLMMISFILSNQAAATTPLRLLTWDSYMDPEVIAEFEEQYDASLQIEVFDSDDQRDVHLGERNGRGYDLIVVDGTQLVRYAQRDWILPVDTLDIPNRRHINNRWSEAFPAADRYGIAYFWGTLGIAWRDDLWPEGFSSWEQLLTPAPALSGKVLMTSHGRELVGIALRAKGISANTSDLDDIEAAGKRLLDQQPHVGFYGYADLDESAPLVSGEAIVAMMYNGDAVYLQELEQNIRFAVPEEGGLLWVDYLAVSAYAMQPTLAAQFLNFINRPDIAARQAEYVQYATPNNAAKSLLSDDFLNNKVIYPAAEVIESSEFVRSLPARSQRRINAISERLKSLTP